MTKSAIDELEFRGSIGNTPFWAMTMNRFINALNGNGWREGSYTREYHFFSSLVKRGAELGIRTPNELARALRDGYTRPVKNGYFCRVCRGGTCWVIFKGNEFITIRHASETF
jgi:hypothetical protein